MNVCPVPEYSRIPESSGGLRIAMIKGHHNITPLNKIESKQSWNFSFVVKIVFEIISVRNSIKTSLQAIIKFFSIFHSSSEISLTIIARNLNKLKAVWDMLKSTHFSPSKI